MKLNGSAQTRLYVMTAVACMFWLIQSLYESIHDGSLQTWPTWVLTISLLIVIAHSLRQAIVRSIAARKEERESSDEHGRS